MGRRTEKAWKFVDFLWLVVMGAFVLVFVIGAASWLWALLEYLACGANAGTC